MKKFLAIVLVAVLSLSICSVFASAEATSQNVAINKPYTIVGIHPNATAPSYPDTDGKELTDGKLCTTGGYGDAEWVGFNLNSEELATMDPKKSSIVIDLNEEFDVTKLVIECAEDSAAGIRFPSAIEFFVSADGTTWTSIGTGTTGDAYLDGKAALVTLEDVTATGRYFKAEMTHSGNWVFVSEFELYALAEQSETSIPETPETGDIMIVFVILAVVAGAGAFVVVKTRR